MTFLNRFRLRLGAALVLGAALQVAASLPFADLHGPYPAIATAFGIAVAVAAGAAGGPWAGLAVAAFGWTLNYLSVADESVRALLALPAWLAAAAAAGWLADRLWARTSEREFLEAELVAIRDSASDAIVAVDADGRIVEWGGGASTMYGYSAEEVEGQPLAVLGGDGAGPDLMEAVRRGQPVESTHAVQRRKGGGEVSASLSVTPLENGAGEPVGALVVAKDVGERIRVQERLDEVETKYESLTAHLPLVTYVYPVGQRAEALYVSPQVERLLGYSAEEWLAEPELFARLVHEDDRERVLEEISAANGSSDPLRTEYRMLARDGRVVSVRDEAVTVRDARGKALYVQGYLLDVSEKERMRTAERGAVGQSREKQRKLDFIAEASAIIASSPDYEVTLKRVADLAVRDLADWCVIDVLDEDGTPTRLVAVHAEPVGPASSAPGPEPEPEVVEVLESARPAISDSRICAPLLARGRALGAITFISATPGRSYGSEDLAFLEGLATTAALAVDDARLIGKVDEAAEAAHVLTYVADGVFFLDRAGAVRLWNPAAEAITGVDASAVLHRPADESIPGWKALSEQIPVGTTGEPAPAATLPIETERGERWISVSGVEFFGGTVYAFRDLTEARRLEELKADFLATASHELRTPLAAVYGAAQTLRRHDFALDEGGRERFISLIVDESERLGRIVNEILLANQLELGRIDLTNESFDAVDLAERVAEAASIHAPPGIEIDVESSDPVPVVTADRDKVRQILLNLVENAMKYSPDGGRIELGVEPAGASVRFRVLDEGLGIPPEEHARIFDKFYRLDPEMTHGVGGTGLGLYICSELVERMGGRIWVESREERGSAFFVEIPLGDGRQRTLAPAGI